MPYLIAAAMALLGVAAGVYWALADDRWWGNALLAGILTPVFLAVAAAYFVSARRAAAWRLEVGPEGIFDSHVMRHRLGWDRIDAVWDERFYVGKGSLQRRLHIAVADPEGIASGPGAVVAERPGSGVLQLALSGLNASPDAVIAEIRRFRKVVVEHEISSE